MTQQQIANRIILAAWNGGPESCIEPLLVSGFSLREAAKALGYGLGAVTLWAQARGL